MSSPHDREVVERLFLQAIELTGPAKKEFLATQLANLPPDMQQEILELLEADQAGTQDKPLLPNAGVNIASILAATNSPEPKVGQPIGSYSIVRRIAEGGFGGVYLAKRTDGVRRIVAIKILRSDVGHHQSILQRFAAERQILADLDHPYITRLLDSGKLEDGRPYFVMEYVHGQPITEYCVSKQLSIEARLRLFQKACQAVAHAHQYGIIHRDLKPTNILVTDDATPKLLDFGIAKVTEVFDANFGIVTETGQTPMTPTYASPEQYKGQLVSQASDVYSLGVVLYEMLTGGLPFRVDSNLGFDLARQVCEQEPAAPSAVIARDPTGISDNVARSSIHKIRGDVDEIVLKALRKSPNSRYLTAMQLRDDIQRHFEGLPVSARKDSFASRASRFIRRHRVVLVTIMLILAGCAYAWKNLSFLSQNLRSSLNEGLLHRAYAEREAGNIEASIRLLRETQPNANASTELSFTWKLLDYLNSGTQKGVIEFDQPTVAVASHVLGKSIATIRDGKVYSLDVRSRAEHMIVDLTECLAARRVRNMTFDDQGGVLAISWTGPNSKAGVEVVTIADNHHQSYLHPYPVLAMDLSADGRWLVTGDDEGNLKIVDVSAGRLAFDLQAYDGHSCDLIALVPGSTRFVTRTLESLKSELRVWEFSQTANAEPPTHYALPLLPRHRVGCVSYSATGDRIFTAGTHLAMLDMHGRPFEIVENLEGTSTHVRTSPDGQTILTSLVPNRLELRDGNSLLLMQSFRLKWRAADVFFSSDGTQAWVISKDGAEVFDLVVRPSPWTSVHSKHINGWIDIAEVSEDASVLAFAADNGIQVWDLDTGQRVALPGPSRWYCDLAIGKGETKFLVASSHEGDVQIWDLKRRRPAAPLIHVSDDELTGVDVSIKRNCFAVGGRGHLSLWRLNSPICLWESDERGWCEVIKFVDGGMITAGGMNRGTSTFFGPGYVRFWDLSKSIPSLRREIQMPGYVRTLAISPDQKTLAVGSMNVIALIDLDTLEFNSELPAHPTDVVALQFHPDGEILLSGALGDRLKLWSFPSMRELGSLQSDVKTSTLRLFRHRKHGIGLFSEGGSVLKTMRVLWMEPIRIANSR